MACAKDARAYRLAHAFDAKNPPSGGLFASRVRNVQTTFRAGTVVSGLKAVVKKLLYISPIFWDSATNVS
jgi:hypothetical protein